MEMTRCSVISRLGCDLMEAYRHVPKDYFESDRRYSEAAYIHRLIAVHRHECPICKHNMELKEKAFQMAVTFFN